MKLFDVVVTMENRVKHWLRIKARSADEAMSQIIILMEPYEVYEMRTKEVK